VTPPTLSHGRILVANATSLGCRRSNLATA